jgi:hypothetical protein
MCKSENSCKVNEKIFEKIIWGTGSKEVLAGLYNQARRFEYRQNHPQYYRLTIVQGAEIVAFIPEAR